MKPSLTLVLSGLFLAFIGHSIWNLILIFESPTCTKGDVCYSSYLNKKPSLDLLLYLTDNSRSKREELILIEKFDYEKYFER